MIKETNNYPVPVVRMIIPDENNRILILQRAFAGHSGGQWCLPGGKVDYGQTVEQTLQAELSEETALQLIDRRFLFYQDSLPPEPGDMHCINFYFECSVSGKLRINEESQAAAWIGPADLASYHIVFRNDEALRHYWENRIR